MNAWDAFVVGIAPQHVPALVAAGILPVVVFVVRRLRPATAPPADPGYFSGLPAPQSSKISKVRPRGRRGLRPVGVREVWVAWLLGLSAAVHLALPLGHFDGLLLAAAFVGSGAAYAWLAVRAMEGRSWRLLSALLIVATLVAYLVVMGTGGEEPDQVGIATALVELAALGLCLVPVREPGRPRRFRRLVAGTATVTATLAVGTAIWVGSFLAHAATDTDVAAAPEGTVVGHTGEHSHEHDHAARAQAGVIMRPLLSDHPTAAQQQAAERLAEATRVASARYATLDAALRAGYTLPKPATGTDVHLENKAFGRDGRVLDPQRPEMLVFDIDNGRATLLGVVFVMEQAGRPGPDPGGPITRWHAHNICLTALPPGFGIVSPFGSCPALSISVTSPEMMHVWIVDNPAGPFAEGLDAAWVRAYVATHGPEAASR
jgi:hypothetical protein